MVAAINAGLEQGVFGLGETENHWEGHSTNYRFDIGPIPAIASASDAGWGEVGIHVALWPNKNAEHVNVAFLVCKCGWGSLPGDVFAMGWLERKNGKWLQSSGGRSLKCRKFRRDEVAAIRVKANGYADKGKFMM
jgi:hypothetical protein